MNGWQFTSVFLANCLVSFCIGWLAASIRYMDLAHRVSSMEAAVTAYWDRIRKRMMVEPRPTPVKDPREMTEQEIDTIVRREGIRWPTHERE